MLCLKNIYASYGQAEVLHGISLQIEGGTVCSLFGRNGAGKTTLLKTIVGLLPISRGSVEFNNEEITKMKTDMICDKGIGLVFQERQVFPDLSVEEHFSLAAMKSPKKRSLDEMKKEVLNIFPDLSSHFKKRGDVLSGGEGQMVKLAMGILRNPKIILLDEPSIGLSVKNLYKFLNVLNDLRKEMTIFITEQNIRPALEIADSYLIIKDGRIIYQKAVEDIAKDEEIVQKHILT
jgi:branched-chain amino acid transport system ATP-binding protein